MKLLSFASFRALFYALLQVTHAVAVPQTKLPPDSEQVDYYCANVTHSHPQDPIVHVSRVMNNPCYDVYKPTFVRTFQYCTCRIFSGKECKGNYVTKVGYFRSEPIPGGLENAKIRCRATGPWDYNDEWWDNTNPGHIPDGY